MDANVALIERIRWSVNKSAISDHYGTVTTLFEADPSPMPQYNHSLKAYKAVQNEITQSLKIN